MRRDFCYTDDAVADLEAIRQWLTQPGAGTIAKRRLTAIWTAIERLRDYPCLGPSIDHPGIRELPCGDGYRALYIVDPDTGHNDNAGKVVILKVYGPGQSREGFGPGTG